MAKLSLIMLLLVIYHLILKQVKCNPTTVTMVNSYCSQKSNGFAMQDEVKYLFNNMSIQSSKKSFYSYSAGENDTKIYGLFHCRKDVSQEVCSECVQDALVTLAMKCSTNSTKAVVWYYECMLLYANQSELPLNVTSPVAWAMSRENVTNIKQFDQLRTNAITQVIKEAANNSSKYFAVQEVNSTLFALALCTPETSLLDCKKCLKFASAKMIECCANREYAMVALTGCQLRYDKYRFYSVIKSSSHMKLWKIAAIATAIFILVAVVGTIIIRKCFNAYKRKSIENRIVDLDEIKTVDSLKFNFNEIKAATNNFSSDNELGRGGFGEVYKGQLKTGEDVAVKRLSTNSNQGITEFKNEVLLVAKLQHTHLVKLLGFCTARKERILVYEFLFNLSLDHFLFDPEKRASLTWNTRFKIITGIARGLQYLHEGSRLKIIHRDLKSANILLDENMNPKISDFGIAKLVTLDQELCDTSRIVGTFGYMAPEYAMAGQFSDKTDVYSFGVMVLEIISGQRNNIIFQQHQQKKEGLLHYAWRLWNEGRMADLIDSLVVDDFSSKEFKIAYHIGLLCTQDEAADRPNMVTIVTTLMSGSSIALPFPTKPHFSNLAAIENPTCTNYYSLDNIYSR